MLTKKKILISIGLLFGILLLINILADRFFVRLDFTDDNAYTLSSATENILGSLDQPVTVTAYFSENLPPNVAQVRRDFRDLLVEYANESDGNVVYDFVDPNKDQETEVKTQRAGVRPIMINVRERDQMKQQRAYLGAVLQYGEKTEVIPFIQPGSAMEYALSSAIKKLTLKSKTDIAFLEGDGEPTLSDMSQVNQELSVLYNVSSVKFNDTTGIPEKYKTLVIVAPKDTINPAYFNQLDDFLAKGGRILVALDRVKADLSHASGAGLYTGFSKWLGKKGINIEANFIVDANCSTVMVRQQQGMYVMNTPVRFPFIPVITNFADHPITKGIESVVMPFVSPVDVSSKDSLVHFTVLARTSERSGIQKPPVYFDGSKRWSKNDFPVSSLPVAVAVEGKIDDGIHSKMVVFSSGDFVVNGSGQNAQKLGKDNINLMTNAIDWLSDDTGLIGLRTKGVTSRPIESDLSDGTKTLIKYANFLVPLLLIIGYGLFRLQNRRRKRNKLMHEEYV